MSIKNKINKKQTVAFMQMMHVIVSCLWFSRHTPTMPDHHHVQSLSFYCLPGEERGIKYKSLKIKSKLWETFKKFFYTLN